MCETAKSVRLKFVRLYLPFCHATLEMGDLQGYRHALNNLVQHLFGLL